MDDSNVANYARFSRLIRELGHDRDRSERFQCIASTNLTTLLLKLTRASFSGCSSLPLPTLILTFSICRRSYLEKTKLL